MWYFFWNRKDKNASLSIHWQIVLSIKSIYNISCSLSAFSDSLIQPMVNRKQPGVQKMGEKGPPPFLQSIFKTCRLYLLIHKRSKVE